MGMAFAPGMALNHRAELPSRTKAPYRGIMAPADVLNCLLRHIQTLLPDAGADFADSHSADHLEHFYDLCVVRALEVPDRAAVESNPVELGHCIF